MSVRTYAGKAIAIHFDATRCIHAAECVRGAPQVFDRDARPWITPDNGEADYLAEVVARCPSGALTATRPDGAPLESPPRHNQAQLTSRGPIYMRGRVTIPGGEHATLIEYARVALCRCGASGNKPFCDGSHNRIGFADGGECANVPDSVAVEPAGPISLEPQPNGPLKVVGTIEFETSNQRRFVVKDVTLCRCGASRNKPFCDGSHAIVGFVG